MAYLLKCLPCMGTGIIKKKYHCANCDGTGEAEYPIPHYYVVRSHRSSVPTGSPSLSATIRRAVSGAKDWLLSKSR